MAEKSSELLLKNEAVKNLNNKIEELQAFTDKFKEEQVKLISELEDKRRIESKDLKAEVSRLEAVLLERKLQSTELDSDAKDAISRMESMKAKYEELIIKVGELNDKNRTANDEIESLTKTIKEIKKFQQENITKIHYFDKLKPLMEKETLFKAFLIVDEVGAITLEDLKNALGSPIVLVKRITQQLEGAGLLETNEQGKIVITKIEEN
jgi:DNA repair exonuclease SbcCD ATPase subunit